MRKSVFIIFVLFLVSSCGEKQDKVERIIEDGVDVVISHLGPYKIKGEPYTFHLGEEFVIDLERNDLAAIGLTEIRDFAVDSTGSIYFSDSKSDGNLIFKFGADGNYLKSFCPKGQGPRELPSAPSVMSTQDDRLVAYSRKKFLFFNSDGSLLREVRTDVTSIIEAKYLDNGNYLLQIVSATKEGNQFKITALYDPQFKKIKELERIEFLPLVAQRVEGVYYNVVAEVNAGKIFIGSQQKDYEIYIYDFNGNLIRKIRKDYSGVSPSKEYQERFLSMFKGNPAVYEAALKKIYFPSSLPPFHYFLTDEKGRLYVMTYETGADPGEYMFDIFDPEGAFTGRKSLKDFSYYEALNGKIKIGHLYCIEEKESGYKELVVYKMTWEYE